MGNQPQLHPTVTQALMDAMDVFHHYHRNDNDPAIYKHVKAELNKFKEK